VRSSPTAVTSFKNLQHTRLKLGRLVSLDWNALLLCVHAPHRYASPWPRDVCSIPRTAAVTCALACICQMAGVRIRKELPNSLQSAWSGAADRLYPGEQFQRFGVISVKLWFLVPFSLPTLLALVLQIMIFATTNSYLQNVNVIGQASTTSLGLTTVFSILATILMATACGLSAYEQVWKAKLKDMELAFGAPPGGPMYPEKPPSYMAGSIPPPSAFLPAPSYFTMVDSPSQFDTMRSTPIKSDFKRPYPSPYPSPRPRPPKSEYSEDSYATTVVTPKKMAFSDWGAPMQGNKR
jgi:hypothetical protein